MYRYGVDHAASIRLEPLQKAWQIGYYGFLPLVKRISLARNIGQLDKISARFFHLKLLG